MYIYIYIFIYNLYTYPYIYKYVIIYVYIHIHFLHAFTGLRPRHCACLQALKIPQDEGPPGASLREASQPRDVSFHFRLLTHLAWR